MQRRTLIAVIGAVIVGSTVGSAAALLRAHLRHADAPVVLEPPRDAGLDAAALAPGDAQTILTAQMKNVLGRFARWSREHAGAACPDLIALGVPTMDPWGHDLSLTCTDQPAGQQVGVISAGADGQPGTEDDIPSWTLGASVTKLVAGPRWQVAAPPTPPAPPSAVPPISPAPEHPTRPAGSHPPTRPAPRRPSQPLPSAATPPPPNPANPAAPSGSAAPAPADTDDIPSRRSPR